MSEQEDKQGKAEHKSLLLLKDLWYTEWDLYAKVSSEYLESEQLTIDKRAIFTRRKKLYLGIKDQEYKVYIRLVYSVMDTLLALEHSDERTVIFNGRKLGSEDYANNINNVAKYDYEQMWCERKKYQVRFDKLFTWAWVEVMDWWDDVLSCPKYKVVNPNIWYPDWFADVNNWPRYHWFSYIATRAELENNIDFFGIDDCLTDTQLNLQEQQDTQEAREQRGLASTVGNKSSDIIGLYYHYTKLDWVPYLTVWANNKSKLIRFEAVPAMTDIEKEDNTKIWFPVIVRNFRPLRDDPFGVSVPDLLEDKEQMQQLFLNLNKIKAEHEALWDLFLFDPDKVDVNNLSIPTIWPKYIPVTGLASIQWGWVAMQEVLKWSVKQDSFNMPDALRNEALLGIGMDNQTLGVQGDSNITATENQRVQGNANLRLTLGIKRDNYAEKEFWMRWYKFYLFYFNDNKEKNFALNDSIGNIYYSVKKKDFGGITDIDVQIKSKSDLDAIKEKEKIGFMAVANIILQNPTTKPSQRSFAMREMFKLNWVPEEKVNRMVEMPAEERIAIQHIALLNKDEMPPKISDLNEDHWTYIVIYDRAFSTDAKWKAISQRMLAMQMSWQTNPEQQVQQQPQDKSMGNMLMNDMMQQSNKQQNGAKSLQTISQ